MPRFLRLGDRILKSLQKRQNCELVCQGENKESAIWNNHVNKPVVILRKYSSYLFSIVLKTGPVIDSAKVLGHWSNHWVTGRTAWQNRIESNDSVIWLGLYNLFFYKIGLNQKIQCQTLWCIWLKNTITLLFILNILMYFHILNQRQI